MRSDEVRDAGREPMLSSVISALADHPLRTAEAIRLEPSPQFGALRQPLAHWASSNGSNASSELCRVLNTSPLSPRRTWRTRFRLWPVWRTICLIAAPSLASAKILAMVSSRRK